MSDFHWALKTERSPPLSAQLHSNRRVGVQYVGTQMTTLEEGKVAKAINGYAIKTVSKTIGRTTWLPSFCRISTSVYKTQQEWLWAFLLASSTWASGQRPEPDSLTHLPWWHWKDWHPQLKKLLRSLRSYSSFPNVLRKALTHPLRLRSECEIREEKNAARLFT